MVYDSRDPRLADALATLGGRVTWVRSVEELMARRSTRLDVVVIYGDPVDMAQGLAVLKSRSRWSAVLAVGPTEQQAAGLTWRELDVLREIARGVTSTHDLVATNDLAGLSQGNVDHIVSQLLWKFRLKNRAQLAVWAVTIAHVARVTAEADAIRDRLLRDPRATQDRQRKEDRRRRSADTD